MQGLNDVLGNLDKLKKDLTRGSGRALDNLAEKVRSTAEKNSPSDTVKRALVVDTPSPFVRDVTVKRGVYKSTRWARRKSKTKSGRRSRARYQPDEAVRFYRFLELGTKYHAAKPFLGKAAAALRPTALTDIAQDIAREI